MSLDRGLDSSMDQDVSKESLPTHAVSEKITNVYEHVGDFITAAQADDLDAQLSAIVEMDEAIKEYAMALKSAPDLVGAIRQMAVDGYASDWLKAKIIEGRTDATLEDALTTDPEHADQAVSLRETEVLERISLITGQDTDAVVKGKTRISHATVLTALVVTPGNVAYSLDGFRNYLVESDGVRQRWNDEVTDHLAA